MAQKLIAFRVSEEMHKKLTAEAETRGVALAAHIKSLVVEQVNMQLLENRLGARLDSFMKKLEAMVS